MFSFNFLFGRTTSKEAGLRTHGDPAPRHVSQHPSYRISGALLVYFALISPCLYAEEQAGDVVQLSQDTQLRNEPTEKGRSLGVLPKGTLLTSRGQTLGKFLRIEVELENGTRLEGWIDRAYLEREAPPNVDGPSEEELAKKRAQKKRVRIPEDEAILLNRAPTFLYGATVGPSLAIIESGTTTDLYSGIGFSGGAFIGTWLNRFVPLRFETLFSVLSGSNGSDPVQFNFWDLAIAPSYLMGPMEVFAGLQYSICLGIGELPRGQVIENTTDLSSIWFFGGLAYLVDLGKDAVGSIRLRYATSALKDPYGFQSISLLFSAELRG